MKIPTKNEITMGCTFLIIGVSALLFLPRFSNIGWYWVVYGIGFFIFPGPQLRDRFKQTEETKAQWRHSAKEASSKSISWWGSPFPWALLSMLAVVILQLK
jgi:hypothetical protein